MMPSSLVPPAIASNRVEPVVLTLFLLSLAVHVLKLGDLALRPHQKKALQARMNSLTLALDYARPLGWFKYLSGDQAILLMTGLSAIALVVALVLAALLDIRPFSLYNPAAISTRYGLPLGIAIAIAVWGVAFGLLVPLALGLLGGLAANELLFEHATIRLFVRRFVLFITIAAVFLSVMFIFISAEDFFLRKILHHYHPRFPAAGSFWDTAVSVEGVGLAFLGRGFFWTVIALIPFIAGSVASILSLVLLLLHFGVRGCSATAWRVVEYEKGAWAAILLLVTVALGVAEAYLKFGR